MMLLPASFVLSCGGDQQQEAEPVIRPVRYIQVYATGGGRDRSFSGSARAGVESRLSFKVAGTIERIPVSVGNVVRKGDLIAELDPTDYELQMQDAEASLVQVESQAKNARASYARIQRLYENANASRSDLDQALAQRESAEANVESVQKKLELAQLQLEYTRLLAPAAGSIASVDVEANENVGVGQTVVMLTAGEVPEVEVSVPEILITQVREGNDVTVKFDAIRNETFSATVTEVGVAALGFATTYPVKVRLDEADNRIRPGMASEVTFRFESQSNREHFVVPSIAVAEDRNGRFVYVVEPTTDEEAVARRRSVTVGDVTTNGLEILEGVSDGDLVVIAGVSRISDGQTVKLLERLQEQGN